MYKMAMLLGLLVAVMSVSAFGVGFMGPPTAGLKEGQWNLGVSYAYMSTDLDETNVKYDDGSSEKIEINDNNVQRYYATIGYGTSDVWEAYVQVGIADVKARSKEPGGESEGFNFDNDFAWGWGTRYTFREQGNIKWGASLQMNWLDTSWDDKGSDWEEKIDYESFDLLVAVGPTVDMGGWKLYGGPFYYMLDGDLDGSEIDMGIPCSSSADLEEDSNIGGFVGAQCMLMEKYCMTTELSFTGDGWAVGAGLSVPF